MLHSSSHRIRHIPWKQLSNGLQKKVSYAMRTGEVSESTFMMLHSMLMPSIEEVVKSSLLLEETSMPASLQPAQDSKSQSSWLKSKLQMMPSAPSINALPKEEVLSLVKSQSREHLLSR